MLRFVRTIVLSIFIISFLQNISYASTALGDYIRDNQGLIEQNEREKIIKIGQEVEKAVNTRIIIVTDTYVHKYAHIQTAMDDVNHNLNLSESEKYVVLFIDKHEIKVIDGWKNMIRSQYLEAFNSIITKNTVENIYNSDILPLLQRGKYSEACLSFYASAANKVNKYYGVSDKYDEFIIKPNRGISMKDLKELNSNKGEYIKFWFTIFAFVLFYNLIKGDPLSKDKIMKYNYDNCSDDVFELPFKLKPQIKGTIIGTLILFGVFGLPFLSEYMKNPDIFKPSIIDYIILGITIIIILLGTINKCMTTIELYSDKITLASYLIFKKNIYISDITRPVYIYGTSTRGSSRLIDDNIAICTRQSEKPIVFHISTYDTEELLKIIRYINSNLTSIDKSKEASIKRDYGRLALNTAIISTVIWIMATFALILSMNNIDILIR